MNAVSMLYNLVSVRQDRNVADILTILVEKGR
jgi:hypothetical protein